MKTRLTLCILALSLMLTGTVSFAAGKSEITKILYQASSFSPPATQAGASVNWNVTNDPTIGGIPAGTSIAFTLGYSIQANGNTAVYPAAVTFGAKTNSKPAGAQDAIVTGLNSPACTFSSSSSTCTDHVTIVAPDIPGAYTVKIQPTSGTNSSGGQSGLGTGSGIAINFTVGAPGCPSANTVLTVTSPVCVLYHQPSATLSATLTLASNDGPLSGQTVQFNVDGSLVGTAVTDGDGVASLSYNSSALAVGDHDLTASYAGSCSYAAAISNAGSLGVTYNFVGFQQPINADGSSIFKGAAITVKIKITDYYGAAVPDASGHVFFAFGTPAIVGTDAEPIGGSSPDSGNTMRYDSVADQYIFNWDVKSLVNGTYTVLVDLNEGSACSNGHTVTLSLQRKK